MGLGPTITDGSLGSADPDPALRMGCVIDPVATAADEPVAAVVAVLRGNVSGLPERENRGTRAMDAGNGIGTLLMTPPMVPVELDVAAGLAVEVGCPSRDCTAASILESRPAMSVCMDEATAA